MEPFRPGGQPNEWQTTSQRPFELRPHPSKRFPNPKNLPSPDEAESPLLRLINERLEDVLETRRRDSEITEAREDVDGDTTEEDPAPPRRSTAFREHFSVSPVSAKAKLAPPLQEKKQTLAERIASWDPKASDDGRARPSEIWNPIWLHPVLLASAVALFILLTVATGLMYHFSEKKTGLTNQHEAHHYAWQYGPSALLVLIASLWHMISLVVRSLMPWKELRHGPNNANTTLLLDYISPTIFTSFKKALVYGHWPVVAVLIGHILLPLATVSSTGLLVLEPTVVMEENVPFSRGTFDGSQYSLDNVGAGPASIFYATELNKMQFRPSILGSAVLPIFSRENGNSSIGHGKSHAATVPGVEIMVNCEAIDIRNATRMGSALFANVTSPDCGILNARVGGASINGRQTNGLLQRYQASVDDYICNSGVDTSIVSSEVSRNISENADRRVLLTVADIAEYSARAAGQDTPDALWTEKITAVLCKLSYEVYSYYVTLDEQGGVAIDKVGRTNTRIPGFFDADLSPAVLRSARQFSPGGTIQDADDESPSLFKMLQLINNNSTLEAFMNSRLLGSSATKAFEGIAAQLIRQMLLSQDTESVVLGTVTSIVNRLHVKTISTGVMCFCFSLMAIFSAVILLTRPHDVVPINPVPISAVQTLTESSTELIYQLGGMGHARTSRIKRALAGETFASRTHPDTGRFVIDIATSFEGKLITDLSHPDVRWWKPFAVQDWLTVAVLVACAGLIGALEGIQYLSDSNEGLLDVVLHSSGVLACYIPAAVTVPLVAVLSSMVMAAAVFEPFASLRKGNAPASRSVSVNYITSNGPYTWFLSLKNGHFGLASILIATLVAPFLTVVISGLFSISQVDIIGSMGLEQVDRVDLSRANVLTGDGGAGTTFDLITHSNLSYPDWTYDDLAFPQLSIPAQLMNDTPGKIELQVTATRAKLNCTSIPMSQRDFKLQYTDITLHGQHFSGQQAPFVYQEGSVLLRAATNLDWSLCERQPPTGAPQPTWNQYFYVTNDSTANHIGKATQLMWDEEGPFVHGDGAIAPGSQSTQVRGYGCPSFAVTLGTVAASVDSSAGWEQWKIDADVGTLVCWQETEMVDTNLHLGYPSLRLLKEPYEIPRTTRLLQNPATQGTSFEFPVNGMLSALSRDVSWPERRTGDLDGFIEALIRGQDGVRLEDISGERNANALSFATEKLYSRYMAQAISQNMRVPRSETTLQDDTIIPTGSVKPRQEPDLIKGTLVQSGRGPRSRLIQNAQPKLALQIMLGCIMLGVIGMRLLLRVNDVLPHNPCSIAGTATLLVDGDADSNNKRQSRACLSDPMLGSAFMYTRSGEYNMLAAEEKRYDMRSWQDTAGKWWFGIRSQAAKLDYWTPEGGGAMFKSVATGSP